MLNAAPYGGGVLAKGSATYQRYVYQEASDEMLDPVRRIEAICAQHGIPPGAAALQFSMRDPRVASTICGVSKPERVTQTLEWAAWPIPEAAWDELLALPVAPTTRKRRATTSSAEAGAAAHRELPESFPRCASRRRVLDRLVGAKCLAQVCGALNTALNRFARTCKQLSALAKVQSVIFIWK